MHRRLRWVGLVVGSALGVMFCEQDDGPTVPDTNLSEADKAAITTLSAAICDRVIAQLEVLDLGDDFRGKITYELDTINDSLLMASFLDFYSVAWPHLAGWLADPELVDVDGWTSSPRRLSYWWIVSFLFSDSCLFEATTADSNVDVEGLGVFLTQLKDSLFVDTTRNDTFALSVCSLATVEWQPTQDTTYVRVGMGAEGNCLIAYEFWYYNGEIGYLRRVGSC